MHLAFIDDKVDAYNLRKSKILKEEDNIRVEIALRTLEYILSVTIFLAGVVCAFLE